MNLPALIHRAAGFMQRSVTRRQWRGDFTDWAAAKAASSGYDGADIFERTLQAIRQVRDGEALFERDSILLDEPLYPFALIAHLLRIALANRGELCVLDFGGALGSSYFQCRPLLGAVSRLRWLIVEQPHYVKAGRTEFETEQLRFHESMQECMAKSSPHVVLFSAVLQYLEEPLKTLSEAAALNIPYLIIDRHPVIAGSAHLLTVQHVPEHIYHASYPSWFFSKSKFQTEMNKTHELLLDHPGFDGRVDLEGGSAEFRGCLYRNRSLAVSP